MLIGWTSENGDLDAFLSLLLSCDAVGKSNRAQWCNADFDKLLAGARTTADPVERAHPGGRGPRHRRRPVAADGAGAHARRRADAEIGQRRGGRSARPSQFRESRHRGIVATRETHGIRGVAAAASRRQRQFPSCFRRAPAVEWRSTLPGLARRDRGIRGKGTNAAQAAASWRTYMKRTMYFAAAAVVALGFAGAAQAKTLTYCSEASPSSFDPSLYEDGNTLDAVLPIYDTLVKFKPGTTEVISVARGKVGHLIRWPDLHLPPAPWRQVADDRRLYAVARLQRRRRGLFVPSPDGRQHALEPIHPEDELPVLGRHGDAGSGRRCEEGRRRLHRHPDAEAAERADAGQPRDDLRLDRLQGIRRQAFGGWSGSLLV